MSKQMMIVVRRPKDHHKGPKTIASWPYGEGVPKGILIGKGAVITIEAESMFNEILNELLEEEINGLQS